MGDERMFQTDMIFTVRRKFNAKFPHRRALEHEHWNCTLLGENIFENQNECYEIV